MVNILTCTHTFKIMTTEERHQNTGRYIRATWLDYIQLRANNTEWNYLQAFFAGLGCNLDVGSLCLLNYTISPLHFHGMSGQSDPTVPIFSSQLPVFPINPVNISWLTSHASTYSAMVSDYHPISQILKYEIIFPTVSISLFYPMQHADEMGKKNLKSNAQVPKQIGAALVNKPTLAASRINISSVASHFPAPV